MSKIKINDLLGKSEKSVITVQSGNNKVKISDLKGSKKIRVADSEKVAKARDAEKAYTQSIATKNRQLPTWQGFTPKNDATHTAKDSTSTEASIGQTFAKSTSDLALDRAIANAREQANGQAWDEESLRLNRLKNDREKLLSYMTPAQRGQYNSTEQKGRDAYIKSIRDELNQKLGTDYAKEALELSEGDYLDRLAKTSALGMSSGLNMFGSGIKGAANAALDVINGKDEDRKVTRSAAEYAYSTLRPEVSGLQGAVGDTMQSLGNMLPSITIGAATGGLGLPLSGVIGTATMGLASGGNSYDEAIKEGASKNKALLYGTANGVKEVLLQQIVGALPGINKADSVVRKFIGKLGDKTATRILGDRAIKDTIVNIMANALSEGTEEAAQEAIETFLGNVILDRDEDYSLKDIAYSGALGAITGGAFPAIGAATRKVSGGNIINNVENVNRSVDNTKQGADDMGQNVGAAETKQTEAESKPLNDNIKRTLKMVNPNTENNQQIYREIMTNNGYGDMVSKMDGIAKRLGGEVQFYADDSASEGYSLGGKIYININNLRSTADGTWKVFKHELTHSLEGTKAYGDLMSSEAGIELYQEFLRNKGYTVTDENGKVAIAPEMLRNEIRERYARNGIKLNEEQLTNECIAKFVEESDILENEESINRLASGSPNFAQRILRWIKDTLSKLGSDYETNRLRKAERLYEKALEQAERGQFEYEKSAKKKFSFNEPVEETKNLIALHNLTEEKLQKALNLGGFPMPSIAVTKADIPHTNFGGITLVMDKSAIDPEANSKNTVYSADAWTPTFPEVEYEANEETRSRISDKYYKLAKEIGYDAVRPLYNYVNDAERQLQNKGGERGIVDSLKDNTDMMNVYLADTGNEYIKPVERTITDRLSDDDIELYEYVADKLGKDTLEKVNQMSVGNKVKWKREHIPKVEEIYKGYLKDVLGFNDEMTERLFESPNFDKKMIQKTLNGTFSYLKNGPETTKTEYDAAATKEAIRKATDQTEYEAWLEELFGGLEKGTGIYNGKDVFNLNGDRRSFSETHYDVTLENIVKAMAEQNDGNTKNVSGFNGIKSLRAGTAESFNSIEDMHKREGRLQHLTEAEAENINETLSDRLSDIINRLYNAKSHSEYDNEFIIKDSIGEILVEIADSGKWTSDNIKKTLKKYGYVTSNGVVENIKNLLNDTAQMPVNIFEAKPERAVKFDEVLAAVVPDSMDTEFIKKLKDNGLNVITYEDGNNDSRIKAVNSVEGAKFSISEDGETELTAAERKYINKATNSLLNNFLEKVGGDKYSDRASLKNEIRAFAEESVSKGGADKAATEKIFEKLFNETVIKDFSDYELYRKAAEEIKNTKLYGGGLGTQEGELRREFFNKVRLVTDPTATKIDSFYKELSNKYPELLDGEIANIDDQVRVMGDIVNRTKAKEETLVEVAKILPQMYETAKTGFESEVENLNKEMKNVAKHKAAREERINHKNTIKEAAERVLSDKEYAKEFYREKAKNQRTYERLRGKELLTPEDIDAMKMMSKGVLTMENIENSDDQYNIEGIKRVYEAFKAKNEYDQVQKQIKNQSRAKNMEIAEKAVTNSDGWKEIGNGLKYSRNTMERIVEALTAKSNGGRKNAEAKMLIDTYFKPIHQNEAKSTRLKNELTKKVKGLGLSTNPEYTVSLENERTGTPMQVKVSESGLVQLLGEGLIDKGTLKRVGADVDKVTNAVKEFRGIYDKLLDMANDVLVENGYDQVQKRKNYFPHFSENKPDTTLGKIGAYFGIETNAELPTDIAGLTDTFRPGKKWVGNFLERNTNITDYDALKGFDRYLGSVADVIYHTNDIQKLRAFETAIRYKYSDKGTKERINKIREDSSLTDEERNNQLEAIFSANKQSHLPNFVTELRNYTDNLAGKKSRGDREWERLFGRNFYNTMKKLENRVSANMVAINPGSWLTNFIPITQVSAITSNKSMLKAILDTERSYFKNDGFAERSDFLTNRRGNEWAYERSGFLGKVDKATDVVTKPFELIDNFASDVVTRALYNEAISKDMAESEAMDYANDMAARLMADRSKGAQPTIFNETNPITKIFTMFQTEVNNQYSYMFKDVPDEVKKKGMGALAGAFFKMFLGAFLYNELYEKVVGRRAAFDPVDIMMSTIGDFADPNMSNFKRVTNLVNNIIDEVPFASGLSGGGRVPVSSALPDIGNLAEAVLDDDMANEKRAQQIGKELLKPAAYLAPPIGGGQIKKGIEALSVLKKGGEYTYDKEGNKKLKYAVENPSAGKYAQGILFGKSSFAEAQDYYNSGSKILSAKQTQNYYKAVEAGINFNQYKEALNAVKGIESDKDSDGKTIALSKAKKMKQAVDEAMKGYNLTKKQKEVLYDACGISGSVW